MTHQQLHHLSLTAQSPTAPSPAAPSSAANRRNDCKNQQQQQDQQLRKGQPATFPGPKDDSSETNQQPLQYQQARGTKQRTTATRTTNSNSSKTDGNSSNTDQQRQLRKSRTAPGLTNDSSKTGRMTLSKNQHTKIQDQHSNNSDTTQHWGQVQDQPPAKEQQQLQENPPTETAL
jgi:hypothetical protein